MIKSLFKLLLIIVVGVLIYNYFLGTDSEKAGARKIFKEFKDVGVAVKDLLKSEKEKFDAGKYDKAVDKIGDILSGLKKRADEFDPDDLDRIAELDRKRQDLQRGIREYQAMEEERKTNPNDEFVPKTGQDSSAIKKELQNLIRETEALIKDLESKQ